MYYNISGVILAGGTNRRFNGIIKSNVVINGKKIISRIAETLKDIFDEIIIVTNTPEEFSDFPGFRIITDEYRNKGPLGGIHAALKASSNSSLFVFGGDMPFLNRSLIINQIEFLKNSEYDVLIPRVNSRIEPLHSIYNISVLSKLEEYLSMENDYAVREFLERVNVKYMQLENTEEARNAFTNINFPVDIIRVGDFLKQ